MHRSIVRIRRNDNTTRAFNACAAVACYIALNIIYRDYWIIINGSTLAIVFCGCTVICCLNAIEHDTDSETNDDNGSETSSDTNSYTGNLTDSDPEDPEDPEDPISMDTVSIEIPPIMAYPISPTEDFTSDAFIIAEEVSIQTICNPETPVVPRINQL